MIHTAYAKAARGYSKLVRLSFRNLDTLISKPPAQKEVVHESLDRTIIILGDSTGVGIGVSAPRYTIGNQIEREFNNTHVLCFAKNGSKLIDVRTVLDRLDLSANIATVIVSIGGLDTLYHTRLSNIETEMRAILKKLVGKKVIVVSPCSFSLSPVIPSPLKNRFYERWKQVDSIFDKLCQEFNATHVSFGKLLNDKVKQDPAKYFSIDKMHPNDVSYALAFEELKKHL